MKIKISYEFDSVEEALAHLRPEAPELVTAPETSLSEPATTAPKTRKPRTPRAPVTIEQAAAPVPGPTTVDESATPAPDAAAPISYPTATHDEALHALRKTFNEKGASAASTLLGQFGAARFSEIPQARYGEFVAKAG